MHSVYKIELIIENTFQFNLQNFLFHENLKRNATSAIVKREVNSGVLSIEIFQNYLMQSKQLFDFVFMLF